MNDTQKPLVEVVGALTEEEQTEMANTIDRVLDDLPPAADDPEDAGLRHSMRTASDALRR